MRLNDAKKEIIAIQNNYSKLENDYRNTWDEKITIECELDRIITKQRNFIGFLIIILFISIIANIISYFV